MKIKSYRAPNLREALVQIKQELGEDALVIETKQVRAGGFFGVGARELVEVRVAPNPQREKASSPKTGGPKASGKKSGGSKKVNLKDDSSAAPARAQSGANARSSATFAALAARTYANNKASR